MSIQGKVNSKITGKTDTDPLMKVLMNIRGVLQRMGNGDQSSRDDMIESIDSLIQSGEKSITRGKLIETIEQSLEVISGFLEDGSSRESRGKEVMCIEELFFVGRLLEKSYINITDVEHAQFFIKEIALKIDQFISKKRIKNEIEKGLLSVRADQAFSDMELQKVAYFAESGRELGDSRPRVSLRDVELDRMRQALDQSLEHEKQLKDSLLALLRGDTLPVARKAASLSLDTEEFMRRARKALEDRLRVPAGRVEASHAPAPKIDNSIAKVSELQEEQKRELERLSQLLVELKKGSAGLEKVAGAPALVAQKEETILGLRTRLEELEGDLSFMRQEAVAKRPRDESERVERLRATASDLEKQLAVKSTELAAQLQIVSGLNEEVARLRAVAAQDKEAQRELYLKLETKGAEIQELVKFREKTEHLRDENARLVRARDKLEEDYLQFHSELKKLKDRMKHLLQQNDELLNEKLFYETKVDRLEARLAEQVRCEDSDKARTEVQKMKALPRKLPPSFTEISSFGETIRKGNEREDRGSFSPTPKPKPRDHINAKILPSKN